MSSSGNAFSQNLFTSRCSLIASVTLLQPDHYLPFIKTETTSLTPSKSKNISFAHLMIDLLTFFRLLVKQNVFHFRVSPSSAKLSRNIGEFVAKNYFTDHWTANTIHLFVDVKGSFSGLFFFWTTRTKGEFPRD